MKSTARVIVEIEGGLVRGTRGGSMNIFVWDTSSGAFGPTAGNAERREMGLYWGRWRQYLDRDYQDREQAEALGRRLSLRYAEARVCLGSTPGSYLIRFREGGTIMEVS